MAGVFRRPFRRAQRRRIVHGGAAVVTVQAPGLHRRRQPMAIRRVFRVRQTVALVVGGVGRAVPIIPIARMLMERHGKIMRERMARKPVMLSAPIPVVAGSTPVPAKPFVPRPPAPIKVPARVPVFGIPAVPGSTPFAHPAPAQRAPPSHRIPARGPVFGVPAVPGVGSVPFVFRPSFMGRPSATLPHRTIVISTAVPAAIVTVCTSGTWSAVIAFIACDSYRLEIDGPATDNVRVSVNIELEET